MDIETAIENGNKWTVTGIHIAKAIAAMDKAKDALLAQMDGIRDNAYCDACMCQPAYGATDEEWNAAEAFNDELHRSIITVDALVRSVAL